MEFTIFKKTGERYTEHGGEIVDDGDYGEYEEIEIDKEEVKKDLVKIIVYECYSKDLSNAHEQLCHVISKFIDYNDLWDNIIENYHDDLRDLYERLENE